VISEKFKSLEHRQQADTEVLETHLMRCSSMFVSQGRKDAIQKLHDRHEKLVIPLHGRRQERILVYWALAIIVLIGFACIKKLTNK
jgi:hypothetical protein